MTTTQSRIKATPQPGAAPTLFSPPGRVYTTLAPTAEAPDLATQLQRERVLGHSFSKVRVQANGLKPRGPGRPLPNPLQHKMEAAFGQDFSSVRLHEDGNAESIGASAYTRGEHVHFKPGAYQPQSRSGQLLLGHELTHVVQQRAGRVALPQGKGLPINADGELEAEADAAGKQAAAGQSAVVRGVSTGVQRKAVVGGGGVVQCGRSKRIAERKERVEEEKKRHAHVRRREKAKEKMLGIRAASRGGIISFATRPRRKNIEWKGSVADLSTHGLSEKSMKHLSDLVRQANVHLGGRKRKVKNTTALKNQANRYRRYVRTNAPEYQHSSFATGTKKQKKQRLVVAHPVDAAITGNPYPVDSTGNALYYPATHEANGRFAALSSKTGQDLSAVTLDGQKPSGMFHRVKKV